MLKRLDFSPKSAYIKDFITIKKDVSSYRGPTLENGEKE